jgi:hypothetical protein
MIKTFVSTLATGIVGLGLFVGTASNADAKDKAPHIKGQTMTVTGCLTQEPKEKNEYLLTGEDGKAWGVKSTTLKVGGHLNHKVTVTGKVTKGEHEREAGDMNVSDLKMVSETCH